jgi:transposase
MSDRFDITLEHELETKPAADAGDALQVRRVEVISGTGRRRRWSTDDKACILVESAMPGANVSDVARRHGKIGRASCRERVS